MDFENTKEIQEKNEIISEEKSKKTKKNTNKNVSYFNKFLGNYLILFINLFLCELLFKIFNKMPILDWANIRIVIGVNLIAIILAFLISFLPKKASRILTVIMSLITSVYTFLQIGFYNYLGVYMSFGTSSQLGAVKDYVGEFLGSLDWTYYLILLPIILTIVLLLVNRKRVLLPNYQRKNIFYFGFLAVIMIALTISYNFSLTVAFMQNPLQQVSNEELIKNPTVPSIAIKEFGTITYGFLDIKALFMPEEEEIIDYTDKEESEDVEEPVNDYSRIIDDTAWNELIKNEKNKTKNNLNNYFINRDITSKNDYTGLFEDKNLIVIMMESINDMIINEEYFPNFYKLYTNGWRFTNTYSPRNSCATGNNEMSGMTGLYSINDSCTANKFKNNTYYQAIFNLFNEKGYYTSSMHNFTEGYYRRSVIHKNMGSSKYYGVQSLKIPYKVEYGKWASDEDFFKKYLEILDKNEEGTKFMTWLTTVSSHQPYSVSSPYGDLYYKEFKNTNYNSATKRYLSKVKVLDNAIGILIQGLEERELLDDTVIVLFADHYPYGLAKSNINKVLGYDISVDQLSDKTPFVIYNPSLESTEFTQYNSYMNITPTLANLFNLDYDPRLYFGQDLLSEDYQSIAVFADGSWKNEHAYYNAANSKVVYYDDVYTVEDIKEISNDVSIKLKMSTLAIKNNYFNYLNKGLEKYKVEEPKPEESPEILPENQNQEITTEIQDLATQANPQNEMEVQENG